VAKGEKTMTIQALDFTKIETWKALNSQQTCERMAQEPKSGDYNPAAASVCAVVYYWLEEANAQNQRAQFFLNCDSLGLRGDRLWKAYALCNENFPLFIIRVLKSDEGMMKGVSKL